MIGKFYNSCLLHIPHSSSFIENDELKKYSDLISLNKSINLLTDHFTDKIFDISNNRNILSSIFPYSRFFIDPERFFDDSIEVMSKIGQGVAYLNDCYGSEIRRAENIDFCKIKKIYDFHHNNLNNITEFLLFQYGNKNLFLDCHSFNENILKEKKQPDICIGFNLNENKPSDEFLILLKKHFENAGLTVSYNTPYNGSLVPNKFLGDKNIDSVMIEINKKIYIKEENDKIIPIYDKIIFLTNLIKNLFSNF